MPALPWLPTRRGRAWRPFCPAAFFERLDGVVEHLRVERQSADVARVLLHIGGSILTSEIVNKNTSTFPD
jgi:hypothetical protein